jgi:metallo-beta-lactamase class B
MKLKTKICCVLVFICAGAWAQHAPLVINHLTGDFYVYTTYHDFEGKPFPSNGLYVVTHAGVVMIDTPWDSTQFQPLLDSIKVKHNQEVVFCISTHFHEDRTGGVDFLKERGIKTYSSKQTFELCKARKERLPELTFLNDTTFKVGEHVLQTYYPGPGHTVDNIVIWFPKSRILYGGCFVKSTESRGLGNIADANVDEWEYSITRTMKKFRQAKHVIPGHQDWGNTNSLQHTLSLILDYKNPRK